MYCNEDPASKMVQILAGNADFEGFVIHTNMWIMHMAVGARQ